MRDAHYWALLEGNPTEACDYYTDEVAGQTAGEGVEQGLAEVESCEAALIASARLYWTSSRYRRRAYSGDRSTSRRLSSWRARLRRARTCDRTMACALAI